MRFPKVMTNLGFITALRYEADNDVVEFKFPKRGKNRMVMACNPKGTALYGMRSQRMTPKTGLGVSSRYFEDAKFKYQEWSGYEIDSYQKCKISERTMVRAGRLIEISYLSDKWVNKQREYFHTFKNATWLNLDNDSDPRLVYITGKHLRITERGIVG